jgi:hypothetical protein
MRLTRSDSKTYKTYVAGDTVGLLANFNTKIASFFINRQHIVSVAMEDHYGPHNPMYIAV